jgi:hypothetical protein
MISIAGFPPAASLPRPILGFAYRTIIDRLPVFVAQAPMTEESRYQIVSPSYRVVIVSPIPNLGDEKQSSLLIHAIV